MDLEGKAKDSSLLSFLNPNLLLIILIIFILHINFFESKNESHLKPHQIIKIFNLQFRIPYSVYSYLIYVYIVWKDKFNDL